MWHNNSRLIDGTFFLVQWKMKHQDISCTVWVYTTWTKLTIDYLTWSEDGKVATIHEPSWPNCATQLPKYQCDRSYFP